MNIIRKYYAALNSQRPSISHRQVSKGVFFMDDGRYSCAEGLFIINFSVVD